MADSDSVGSGTVGIVAIFMIFIILVVGGFLAYRAGLFGGKKTTIDINVTKPQ